MSIPNQENLLELLERQNKINEAKTRAEEQRKFAEEARRAEELRTQALFKEAIQASNLAKKSSEEAAEAYRQLYAEVRGLVGKFGNVSTNLDQLNQRTDLYIQVTGMFALIMQSVAKQVGASEQIEKANLILERLVNTAVTSAPVNVGGASVSVGGDMVGNDKVRNARTSSGVFNLLNNSGG